MIGKRLAVCLTLGLALAVGIAMLPQIADAQNVVKIGVFDLQRAINKSKKGQAAKAALTKKLDPMEKDLKRRESELEKLQKELETQSSMLSPEAKRQKMETLNSKYREFQERVRKFREEVKKSEDASMTPLVNKIVETANKIGREGGYTIVLEGQRAGVIYAPDNLDITNEVIRRIDSGR
jgi:outer membrane protein